MSVLRRASLHDLDTPQKDIKHTFLPVIKPSSVEIRSQPEKKKAGSAVSAVIYMSTTLLASYQLRQMERGRESESEGRIHAAPQRRARLEPSVHKAHKAVCLRLRCVRTRCAQTVRERVKVRQDALFIAPQGRRRPSK